MGRRRLWGSSGLEERVTKADVYNSPGWRRMQENSQATRQMSAAARARGMW
jgi:DNA helicase-2/ATP-dependent DNA helicase PcrA